MLSPLNQSFIKFSPLKDKWHNEILLRIRFHAFNEIFHLMIENMTFVIMWEEVAEAREEEREWGGGGVLRSDWHLSGSGANCHHTFIITLSWHLSGLGGYCPDTIIKPSWHYKKNYHDLVWLCHQAIDTNWWHNLHCNEIYAFQNTVSLRVFIFQLINIYFLLIDPCQPEETNPYWGWYPHHYGWCRCWAL